MRAATSWFVLVLFTVGAQCALALENSIQLPAAERLVLENGVVLVLNEKRGVPLIGLEAIVHGGAVSDPLGKHGLSDLLAGLLQKGAGDRDAATFAEAVDAVGGRLSAEADLESVSVSADFMSKDAALMVELVADMLQRPTLAVAEFNKLKERSINLIKATKGSDPGNLMPAYANAFLFGDHPYGNPPGGSETSLRNITHRDLRNFYSSMFGGNRLIVSVSGDFDVATMRETLIAAFANWGPASGALPEIAAPERAGSSRVYLIDKPGATQTYFYIGNVAVARNFAGRADLDLANAAFGGRFTSMLMTALRTKSGLSYTASASLTRNRQPGSFFIRSFTETSTTVEAIDVAIETLRRLREYGLSESAVTSARNYIMGQFPPRLETPAQLAEMFAMLEAYGLGASYIDGYGEQLAAATPASVAAVIDTVYPPANELVFTVLGDADSIREAVARYGPVTEIAISEARFRP